MGKPSFLKLLGDDPLPKKQPAPRKTRKAKPKVKKKPGPKPKRVVSKSCPKCGTKHTKPGMFCSRTCSNSRTWTEEDKQKKKEAAHRYYATPESIDQREAVAFQNTLRHADDIEDVEMLPYVTSLENNNDYVIDQDGDVWEDVER